MKNDLPFTPAPAKEERIVSRAFLSGLLDPMSRLARKLCAGTDEDEWKMSVLAANGEALSLYRQEYFVLRPSNVGGALDTTMVIGLTDALADFEPYLSLPSAMDEQKIEKFRNVVRQLVAELLPDAP